MNHSLHIYAETLKYQMNALLKKITSVDLVYLEVEMVILD
jgi:hypothetical protein